MGMPYDWYKGTMNVPVYIDDVLGTMIDYLHYEDVPCYPFEHHGRNYLLTIKEDRDRASVDAIESYFDKLIDTLTQICKVDYDNISQSELGIARSDMENALIMAKALKNEYWTCWKKESE